jgi:flagellar motor protein MotB
MFDHDDETPTGGYWPSVTDLFMTLFIVSIVMLGAVFYVLLPKNNIASLKSVQIAVGEDFVKVLEPTNRLRAELGLQPIVYKGAKQVIRDLSQTCDAAVERLAVLKKNDPSGMAEKIELLQEKIKELEAIIEELRKQLTNDHGPESIQELLRRIKQLEAENQELKRQNTNIVIDEKRAEFRFDPGSPIISPKFSNALRTRMPDPNGELSEPPFPRIAAEILKRPDRVDTLEVIGHTDGVPLTTSGNLDQRLPDLLAGELGGSGILRAGSNNDLGLLRALALKHEWQAYVESYEPLNDRDVLQSVDVRCYSAGQTILPIPEASPEPDSFRRNDPSARRIEMRLTRLENTDNQVESND